MAARTILFNADTLAQLETVRKIIMNLPGAEEYLCYGTPAFRVKKKLLARLREDGESLAVHADDRDIWLTAHPEAFFITDHYFNYPTVLVHLTKASPAVLQQVLTEAWIQCAPKTVVYQWLIEREKA